MYAVLGRHATCFIMGRAAHDRMEVWALQHAVNTHSLTH
jgi:hypothetical protein